MEIRNCCRNLVTPAVLVGVLCLAPVGVAPEASDAHAGAPAAGESTGDDEHGDRADTPGYRETVIVTASRTEQPIARAPVATSVIDTAVIEGTPVDDFGDLLRGIPGVNVAQMNDRDVAVATRQATAVLPQGQLVLVDNRSVYQEYNGFVIWDSLPIAPWEIERIEVVRGPGSAVWGANATDGVVNIITKAPRDMVGTTLVLGAGGSSTREGSITHAGVAGRIGYKVSASYFEQDPYDRPTGTIPGTVGPTSPLGTPYPEFGTKGTEQPRVNLRVDFDQNDDTTWSFDAGWAGTGGIIFTPGGPWEFGDSTDFAHFKAGWSRKSMDVVAYVNDVDYRATLLFGGATLRFRNRTYNVDLTDTRLIAGRHILTYGANVRHNDFDLDFAPGADDRDDWGVFVQDEIQLGEKVRWLIGARLDDIDPIDPVVSPRTSLMIEPVEGQIFRASFNSAYIAPTAVENHILLFGASRHFIPTPGGVVPAVMPFVVRGNTGLEEEKLDAFEIGWTGLFGDAWSVSASLYRNEIDDLIRQVPTAFYSPANPPPGWPLDPALLGMPPPAGFAGVFPSEFGYVNIGEIVNEGVELALDVRPVPAWRIWANYTWQDEPDDSGLFPIPLPGGGTSTGINIPPEHRANLGLGWDNGRCYVHGNVNSQDQAFWTDILDSRFWGPSDSFTQVNLAAGVRLHDDTVTLSVRGQNIFDEDVQQHVWADFIRRKVTGQLAVRF